MRRMLFLCGALAFAALSATVTCRADEMVRADKNKIRMVIAPGQAATGTISVDNPGSEPKTIRMYLEDWTYLEPFDGSKDFSPAGTNAASAGDWITFSPPELALGPNGRGTINYTVKVPGNAEGTHHSALFLESMSTAAGTGGVGVNLAIRVAVLFFIEAESTVKREILVPRVSVKRSAKGHLDIALPVTNAGNGDLTIGGSFNIMSSTGMVTARGELNTIYTLPGNTGQMQSSWSLPIAPGTYSLILTLDLGKALEEAGTGRGPVVVKEASLTIAQDGSIAEVGALR
jgi:hypothetical protein